MTSHNQQSTPPTPDEFRELLHRRMLSSVSHDLKTPLATMIGSLEVYQTMQDKLTPEKKAALITAALGEAYRLDNFITNILDMAKLEEGTVVPRADWCDVDYILHDCIARLGPKSAESNITVRAVAGAAKQNFIDPMLLGRAVSLLLDNAIKYGGKTPIVMEYGGDHQAFIRVRDHGTGIPPGKEQEIFSKYTRFNHRDYQNAGTGLGLPLCRHLMRLLRGTVTGENHSGGGAVFTLSYPQE